jgi:hypothetical protein
LRFTTVNDKPQTQAPSVTHALVKTRIRFTLVGMTISEVLAHAFFTNVNEALFMQ